MAWKVPQNGFYLVRNFNYLNLDKEIYEPGKLINSKTIRAVATWKMFVFGVFLVCIFLYSCISWFTKTRTKKPRNTETFYIAREKEMLERQLSVSVHFNLYMFCSCFSNFFYKTSCLYKIKFSIKLVTYMKLHSPKLSDFTAIIYPKGLVVISSFL